MAAFRGSFLVIDCLEICVFGHFPCSCGAPVQWVHGPPSPLICSCVCSIVLRHLASEVITFYCTLKS
eukprot:jgi/Botrbrau1/10068/Bobra.0355s0023.1